MVALRSSRLAALTVVGLCACLSTTGPTTETRGSIAGHVELDATPGLNDLSRVRIDLGNGEGGTVPDEQGNFELADLEPDVYELTVTYVGGLSIQATGSAYARLKQRVVLRAGQTANLGTLKPELAKGSLSGSVVLLDGQSPQGAEVTLSSGNGETRTILLEGDTFAIPDVTVGFHTLRVTKDGYAAPVTPGVPDLPEVCGTTLAVNEESEAVTLVPIALAPTTASLLPGTGEVFLQQGETWHLSGSQVTVRVLSAYAALGRSWWDGEARPELNDIPADGYLLDAIPAGRSVRNFQFHDACVYESPVHAITFIRDVDNPTLQVVELNGGAPQTRESTVLLRALATDATSSSLDMHVLRCPVQDDTATCPTDDTWIPYRPEQPLALGDVAGTFEVRVQVRDLAGNTSEEKSARVTLDRTPPQDVSITVGDGSGFITTSSPTVRVTATGASAIKWGEATGLAGVEWQPLVPSFTVHFTTTEGPKDLYVMLRDEAGNTTDELHVTVTLDQRGLAQGRVTLEGNPDASSVVVSADSGQQAAVSASGNWLLDGLPAGNRTLTLRVVGAGADAYGQATRVVAISPRSTTPLDTVLLPMLRGLVGGLVALEDGAAPAGVVVEIAGSTLATTTGSTGAWNLSGVPVGTVTLTFSKPGYLSATTTGIQVTSGQLTNVALTTLSLLRGSASGTLGVEDGGDPTLVEVVFDSGQRVFAGSDGSWSLGGIPVGTHTVQLRPTGTLATSHAVTEVNVVITTDTTTVPPTTVPRTRGTASGTVALEGGASPTGILVELVGTPLATTTSSTGGWSLVAAPTGSWEVRFSRAGYASASVTGVSITANNTTTVPPTTLTLLRGSATGTVSLEGGGDATLIQVVSGAGQQVFASAAGAWTLTGVPVGEQTLELRPTGTAATTHELVRVPASVDVGSPVNVGSVVLPRMRGALSGAVLLEDGATPAGVVVEVVGTSLAATTNSAGTWSLTGVPTGTVEVRFSRPSYVGTSVTGVVITAGSTTTVPTTTLSIERGSARGVVTLEGGASLSLVQIVADTGQQIFAAADGTWTLTGIPVGVRTLELRPTGSAASTHELLRVTTTITNGATSDVGTRMSPRLRGNVAGVTLLEGGATPAGILVEVVGTGLATSTNSAGEWALSAVPAATVEVRFSKAGYVTSSATGVVIPPGGSVNVPTTTLSLVRGSARGVVSLEEGGNPALVQIVADTGEQTFAAADGTWTLGGIPVGARTLELRPTGTAATTHEVVRVSPTVDASSTVDVGAVVVPRMRGALSGVVSLEDGATPAGVVVEVVGTSLAATTNSAGTWSLSGVPTGTVEVRFSRSNYVGTSVTGVVITAGSTTTVPTTTLSIERGSARGVVTLEGGASPTLVQIVADTGQQIFAAADGTWTLTGIPVGVRTLELRPTGSATSTHELIRVTTTITNGATSDVGARTSPRMRGNLTGVAALEDAANPAGIVVEVVGTGLATTTSSTGEWTLPGVPAATVDIRFSKAGYVTTTANSVQVTNGTTTTVTTTTLALQRGGAAGLVLLEDGADATLVQITVDSGQQTFAASDGTWTLTGIPVGVHTLDFRPTGAIATSHRLARTQVTVSNGVITTTENVVITVARGAVSGVVLLEDGRAPTGAVAEVVGAGIATAAGSTGSFVLSDIPAGTVQVQLSMPGYVTTVVNGVNVQPDLTTTLSNVTLALQRGVITGVVALEGGGDPSVVEVATDSGQQVFADAAGNWTLTGVPVGTRRVELRPTGTAATTHLVETLDAQVDDSQTTALGAALIPRARGTLVGVATLEGTADATGILAEILGSSDSTTTTSTGNYTLAQVPTGTVTVRLTRSGYLPVDVTGVVITAGQTTTVPTRQLLIDRGTLRGLAVHDDATDHSGILVSVLGTGLSATTDATGAWTIPGVPPGLHNVLATRAGYDDARLNGIYLPPGQDVNVGTLTLTRRRGVVRGVATLEGQTDHSGVVVTLLNTTFQTSTDSGGVYEFRVPLGNYDGVSASRTHFATTSVVGTITVTESGTATVAAVQLDAVSNEVRGRVTRFGAVSHDGIQVQLLGLPGEVTENLVYTVTTPASGDFTFSAAAIGPYNIRYSYPTDPTWETVTLGVDVTPGAPTVLLPVELRQYFVTINNYAAFTNNATVSLSLGASNCRDMCLSEDTPCPVTGPWTACATSTTFPLSNGDGIRTVYARFRDNQDVVSDPVSDDILLDRTAAITSVTQDTGGVPKGRNDVIHFRLVAANAETPGTASVDVVGYAAGLTLYDDGTHGDPTAADGAYELSYTITGSQDVVNATVTGRFTDAHGNTAAPLNAAGTITVAIPPLLRDIVVVPDSATGTAVITFDTDESTTARIDWGTDNTYGNSAVDGTFRTTHTFTLSGLSPSTAYHYRLQATDVSGNTGSSTDRVFYVKPNPPSGVTAIPGVARLDLRWDAPPQRNVAGYNVYRSTTSGGGYVKLNGALHVHEALMYPDLTAAIGTTYFYVVTAVDDLGNESDFSTEVSGTPGTAGSGTNVSGALVGDVVWSARGSPYNVVGSLAVQPGNRLTVGPGVTINFTGNYFIRVDGTLVVVGDSGAGVTIQGSGGWRYIQFTSSSSGSAQDREVGQYLGGNLVYRATVRDARESALKVENTSLTVMRSTLRLNGDTFAGTNGAAITTDNAELLVMSSTFEDNVGSAVYVWRSDVDILGTTTFARNDGKNFQPGGLTVTDSSLVRVEGARFEANEGNRSVSSFTGGSAVQVNGYPPLRLDLVSCNFVNNGQASGFAPIHLAPSLTGPVINVVNSTFSGNRGSSASVAILDTVFGGNSYRADLNVLGSQFTNNNGSVPVIDGFGSFQGYVAAQANLFNSAPAGTGSLIHDVIGPVRWNHFSNNLNTGGMIRPKTRTTALNSNNSFLTGNASPLVRNTIAYGTGNDVTATSNWWGAAVTAEMDANGSNANISAIHDFYDDIALSKILYDSWAPNAYPLPQITGPRFARRYNAGDTVSLVGTANDPEDGALSSSSLRWVSDKDGALGTGATLNTTTLSVNTHRITLIATDSSGQEAEVWTEVVVQ
ncbi:MAG: carboxypeptidase regulatory-like domain-containing protein [Myxococcota bacterium]